MYTFFFLFFFGGGGGGGGGGGTTLPHSFLASHLIKINSYREEFASDKERKLLLWEANSFLIWKEFVGDRSQI